MVSVICFQVNCETDFVAKNENFQGLVAMITGVCHNYFTEQGEPQVCSCSIKDH